MSTLRTNTLQNAAGSKSVPVDTVVDGTAKAWVNFNGTGTVAIRASFNVSSITDNGTGDYTVNFTTAMTDANYTMCSSVEQYLAGASSASNVIGYGYAQTRTTTAVRIYTRYTAVGSAAMNDLSFVELAFFR